MAGLRGSSDNSVVSVDLDDHRLLIGVDIEKLMSIIRDIPIDGPLQDYPAKVRYSEKVHAIANYFAGMAIENDMVDYSEKDYFSHTYRLLDTVRMIDRSLSQPEGEIREIAYSLMLGKLIRQAIHAYSDLSLSLPCGKLVD